MLFFQLDSRLRGNDESQYLLCLCPHMREQNHIPDARAISQQHDEAVDTYAFSGGRW
jgi:hypothetical protein